MKKADIKIGFLCNNNCVFCVQAHKKKFGDISLDVIKKNIIAGSKDCDGIVFTGGEPTIKKGIEELVVLAVESGYKTIQMQTNGRMFAYSEFCKKMISLGVNEFAPALHGHTPELHNWLTGSDSFHQTVAGIRNLVLLKQKVLINVVVVKSNYRHLPEIAKLLISLGVTQFQFAFVHAVGAAERNFDMVVPRMSLVMPYIKRGLDLAKHFKVGVMTEAIPFCFMTGYEEYMAETIPFDSMVYDYQLEIGDYKKYRITEGKLKGPNCDKCKHYKYCEGTWREYPEKFGWKEFKPVKK